MWELPGRSFGSFSIWLGLLNSEDLHTVVGWVDARYPAATFAASNSFRQFEYLDAHLFGFSFIPASLAGSVNARFRHKAAQFVWLVPAAIPAYKFATFAAPSVLQSQFSAAFHQYFGGGFMIPEFRDWHDFWAIVGSNSDMTRGLAQLEFTAPFYAAVGCSVAAWIGRRTELNRKVAEKVKTWEESRFEHH
jgi:hypothetical protein